MLARCGYLALNQELSAPLYEQPNTTVGVSL
jgi:hypothetical protein